MKLIGDDVERGDLLCILNDNDREKDTSVDLVKEEIRDRKSSRAKAPSGKSCLKHR